MGFLWDRSRKSPDLCSPQMWWRWCLRVLAVIAASWPAAVLADFVLGPHGLQPLPCFPPGPFWSMFERCEALSGEHLFGVAAMSASAGAVAWLATGRLTSHPEGTPATLNSKWLLSTARLGLGIGTVMTAISIVDLFASPQRLTFATAIAVAFVAALSAPQAVPRRFLGVASTMSVFTVVFAGVALTALFTEHWVS